MILALAIPEISLGAPKFKVGHVILSTPISRVIQMLGLDTAYMCTKFDDCSFSRSRDMVAAHQDLNASRNLTTPLSGIVCHLWTSTSYGQPICHIRSLLTRPTTKT